MVDETTGLPSRRSFFQRLSSLGDRQVIVAIFDIDDFRFINFSHGYKVGDAILKATETISVRYSKSTFQTFL